MRDKASRKTRLVERLRYLWRWELFDSVFLPAVVLFISKTQHKSMGLFTVYSLGLVTCILWQGAAYWWLKLQALQTNTTIRQKYLRWFKGFKKANWVLIGILPVLLAGNSLLGTPLRLSFNVIAGLSFYILAILEQINYYYYQLMYDCPSDWHYLIAHKKLKRSSLNRDLKLRL